MSAYEIPATGSAEVHVLNNGYAGLDGDDERVSGPGHGAPFRPPFRVVSQS